MTQKLKYFQKSQIYPIWFFIAFLPLSVRLYTIVLPSFSSLIILVRSEKNPFIYRYRRFRWRVHIEKIETKDRQLNLLKRRDGLTVQTYDGAIIEQNQKKMTNIRDLISNREERHQKIQLWSNPPYNINIVECDLYS
jgi:hypothetical protein